MIIRRRGGIIRGVTRTAIVAGTATAVSKNVSDRMDRSKAQETAKQTAETRGQEDTVTKLENLTQLKNSGALTQQEFEMAKRKILEQ